MISIQKATLSNFKDIWPIFKSVISTGDTYVFPETISYDEAQSYWMSKNHHVYIAEYEDRIVGTYIFKENHIGRGSHIANASFMVHPDIQGKRIGRTMAEHCLKEAQHAGFTAMQFNIVVSTNTPAINLWIQLGFTIIGTIPEAFQHKTLGFVDAHIMYKKL